jgi:hypothetical protein
MANLSPLRLLAFFAALGSAVACAAPTDDPVSEPDDDDDDSVIESELIGCKRVNLTSFGGSYERISGAQLASTTVPNNMMEWEPIRCPDSLDVRVSGQDLSTSSDEATFDRRWSFEGLDGKVRSCSNYGNPLVNGCYRARHVCDRAMFESGDRNTITRRFSVQSRYEIRRLRDGSLEFSYWQAQPDFPAKDAVQGTCVYRPL